MDATLSAVSPLAEATLGKLTAVGDTIGARLWAIRCLAAHALHLIGVIAGATFVTGAGGNALGA